MHTLTYSVSFENKLPLLSHGFEFISCVLCQLALFLLERSPPLMNYTAAVLDFPGIMAE